MTIWIDGEFRGDATAPVPGSAWAPFETMGAERAEIPLLELHFARLTAAARRCGLAFSPTPELRAAATELLLQNGDADGVLRLLLVPGQAGRPHATVLSSRPRAPLTKLKLLPTVVARPADAPPADLKVFPRRFYDAVLQQAQDGGADDGIVVADDGAVLEAALGNLWLRLDGGWVTPPLDGRVLPGIARARLLALAHRAGLRVRERPCDLGDLERAEAVAHSNAVYGPRAAGVGGKPAAVEIVDRDLGTLWRGAARV